MTFTAQKHASRRPAPRRVLSASQRHSSRPQRVVDVMSDVDALGAHWEAMQQAMDDTRALRS